MKYGLILVLLLAAPMANAQANFTIAASIRPLAGIASAIADGSGIEVEPIITPGDSLLPDPDLGTKPSYVNKIRTARVVMLIDRHYEQALDDPLEDVVGDKVIEASGLPGVNLLNQRRYNVIKSDMRGVYPSPDDNKGNQIDYRLWLDPSNALRIAASLRDRLIAKMPDQAARFEANYKRFETDVATASEQTLATVIPASSQSYAAVGDQFQYFDRRFLLRQAAILDNGSDPDDARIDQISNVMTEQHVPCLVAAPADEENGASLAEASHVPVTLIDPEGADIPLGSNFYPQLLNDIAGRFARCLQGAQTLHQ